MDIKDGFYSRLDCEIELVRRKYGRGIDIFIGGDFNARLGNENENIWDDVKGNFCRDVQNENGLLLLEFCLRNRLKIANSFFQKKDYGTWIHPRSKSWITLDYMLVSQHRFRNVMNCGVNKLFEIFSDHRALMLDVVVPKFRYKHREKIETFSKLDFKELEFDKQLCSDIGQWFDMESESIRSFEDLVVLLNKCSHKFIPVQSKSKSHKDWFDKNSVHLLNIIEMKRIAKQQNNMILFKKFRGELQRECRRSESGFWKNVSSKIQELHNKNQMQLFFQNIQKVYGNKRCDVHDVFLLNLGGSISKTKEEIKAR